MRRLNGSKRLVRGNHDIFGTKYYLEHFKEIYGVRVLNVDSDNIKGMVLTHIPLHSACITQRYRVNIHGHLHANIMKTKDKYGLERIDPLYFGVSVEQIDYTPIELSDLCERIQKNFDTYGEPNYGKLEG